MDGCVRRFARVVGVASALEAASLHPARCLGISQSKGTLETGADADFIILSPELDVMATFIAGQCVYVSGAASEAISNIDRTMSA